MHVQNDHSHMHCSHECLGLDCKPCMQVCEEFLTGFPHWWQSCTLLYPKLPNSHTECQPCSSNTSSSGVDSSQFYLEKYEQGNRLHSDGTYLISKFRDILRSSQCNDAVFKQSSNLLNGKPRFEEYTCDGDIATNENAAASSEAATGKCRGNYLEASVSFCHTNISFQRCFLWNVCVPLI